MVASTGSMESYDKLDDEKFYLRKPDNSYVVHFPNGKAFPESLIWQMFEKHGEVLSVDIRQKPKGLCYVRYNSEEAARKCVASFRQNKIVKILPHKSQLKKNTISMSSNNEGKESEKMRMINKKLTAPNHGGSTQFMGKQTPRPEGSSSKAMIVKHAKNQKQDSLVRKERTSDNSLTKNNHKLKEYTDIPSLLSLNIPSSVLKAEPVCDESVKDYSVASSRSSIVNNQLSIDNSAKLSDDLEYDSKVPKGRGISRILSRLSIAGSNKSARNSSVHSKITARSELAQEVIIANVHELYSIHYILHLLEKHNPISVSLMKTIPISKIRYCHVYFTNWEEALATQQEFDNYVLDGKKLIVLTSENLNREALAI